jgi:hypothetical protein
MMDMKKLYTMLKDELELHPLSKLGDMYKLFMQSVHGAGHIIKDKDSARLYLKKELETFRPYLSTKPSQLVTQNSDAMPISAELYPCHIVHCDAFFPLARYSLQLIIDDIISFDTYFEAFMVSAEKHTPLPMDEFKDFWQEAVAYLSTKNIVDFKDDLRQIEQLFADGKYLVSHSDTYRLAYNPTYRIINKEIMGL